MPWSLLRSCCPIRKSPRVGPQPSLPADATSSRNTNYLMFESINVTRLTLVTDTHAHQLISTSELRDGRFQMTRPDSNLETKFAGIIDRLENPKLYDTFWWRHWLTSLYNEVSVAKSPSSRYYWNSKVSWPVLMTSFGDVIDVILQ